MKYDHMGCPFNDPPPEDLVTARKQLTLGLDVIKMQAADLAAARERILELESERDRLRETMEQIRGSTGWLLRSPQGHHCDFRRAAQSANDIARAALDAEKPVSENTGETPPHLRNIGTIPNYRETIVWPEHERPGKPRRELPVDPTPEEDDVFPRGPGGE